MGVRPSWVYWVLEGRSERHLRSSRRFLPLCGEDEDERVREGVMLRMDGCEGEHANICIRD